MCQQLGDLIGQSCGDEQRSLIARRDRHLDHQKAHREEYCHNRHKAASKRNQMFDMSCIVDAAGGTGTTHLPRMNFQAKSEPERSDLLKVKSVFSKIHGLGTQIFLTYPNLYKEGANLALEAIYRSVRIFLQRRKVSRLRTLYVQMDNVSYNKCWTLFAGLSALISLEIVQKVKVSYCVVGHTHEDVDAIIGTVISHLRKRDIQSFTVFEEEVRKSINKHNAQV